MTDYSFVSGLPVLRLSGLGAVTAAIPVGSMKPASELLEDDMQEIACSWHADARCPGISSQFTMGSGAVNPEYELRHNLEK